MTSLNLAALSQDEIKQLQGSLTPRWNKYMPGTPTPTAKQTAALLLPVKELLFGGAAGGGKSHFLLYAALQYVDVPGYSAILFRRTFSDLMLPGALIPKSHEWLDPWIEKGEVKWYDKEKRYVFLESGATLSFGYLETKDDHYRYQGAEFQFVGMDEITHIIPESSRYLFSRLRRLKGSPVPVRFRATCNPGGPYGDYYYQRYFVDNIDENGRVLRYFLQSSLNDNPYLDAEAYRESLAELDPITRAQLEHGDWEIRPTGDLFDQEWFISIHPDEIPKHVRWVRFWDLAAIDPKYRKRTGKSRTPDSSVGFKLGFADGCYYIGDIIKVQKTPGDMEDIIRSTALADGYSCAIRMEEEGGASGKANTERYARVILPGFDFAGVKPVVSKIERARPVAAAAQTGSIFISTKCRFLTDFYSQIAAFPAGVHDDIVDAFSGAFAYFRPSVGAMAPPPKRTGRVSNFRRKDPLRAYGPVDTEASYWRVRMSAY